MTMKLKFYPGAALVNFVFEAASGFRNQHEGDGVKRARRDLNAHRAAQAERLIDADDREMSRQQRRQMERRQFKMPLGVSMKDWHRFKGYPV